jgi:hypothetical protein
LIYTQALHQARSLPRKGRGSKTSNNTAEINKPLTKGEKKKDIVWSRRAGTIDNAEMSRKEK